MSKLYFAEDYDTIREKRSNSKKRSLHIGDSDCDAGGSEKSSHWVPSYYIVPLVGFYLLLAYLTQLIEDEMPSVVKEADLAADNYDTFSEETAYRYLLQILGDQPRVAGTEYHLNKTYDVKEMVDRMARDGRQKVHTDWQIVSGDYHLGTKIPYVNVYENASNIIAVLEGESGFNADGTTASSVLVNCHYDSVPFAMGASDNAVFCAVMMEVLSKMSKRPNKLKHNIVFLFNGAEENPLQASHGFLKHPWAKGINALVNLDAAGMNGKPTIFQVTDPRVLKAYQSSVNRPSAQSFGEALFASGIIPSDTDFRLFRDFGQIQGIDIAFVKWATVYHTRYDSVELLKSGVIQNAGNMLYNTMATLADTEGVDTKVEATSAVYFDFLYIFMISYSVTVSYVVDVVIVVGGLLSVAYYLWHVGATWSTYREFLYAILGRMLATLGGALVVVIFTAIMVASTIQLRYLSNPWIVVPIFWVPYFIGATATSHLYDYWRNTKVTLTRSTRVLQASAASRLLACLTALLTVLTPIPTYVVTVMLFVVTVTSIFTVSFARRLKAWQHLLLSVLLSVPSVMFVSSLSLRLDAIMLPIMGRSSNNTPDYIIGAMNMGLALLLSCILSGVELLFSRRRLWVYLSGLMAACVVLMVIPFDPYSDNGPATMRHYWHHSEIVSHANNDTSRTTGVMFTKMDGNWYTFTRGARVDNCVEKVYCDLPMYRPSFGPALSEAKFLQMEGPPALPTPPSLTAKRNCEGNTCVYDIQMNGTNHNTITIWPIENATITEWTLNSPLIASFTQLQRPVYVIIHSMATFSKMDVQLNFSLKINVPTSLQSSHLLDVSHHAFKIHHPELFTDSYKELLQSAPKYYNIASFLSYRHNYQF